MLGKRTYNKMMMLITALMLSSISFAQYNGKEDLEKSKVFWNEFGANKTDISKLDSAKKYIELSFGDDLIKNMGSANNLKGAIYKELYKAREMSDYKSFMREAAAECFLQSMKLDTTARNKDIWVKQLNWISVQYHNDAKRALEKHSDFAAAEENFQQFKKLKLICDPSFNMKPKELEFELALASAYQDKGVQSGKREFTDMAKVTYLKILEAHPANGDANFNLATMYYNQGANIIIKTMDYDTPLDSIPIYEEMANKLFRQAEPFMLAAHGGKPNCLKILEGLKGIYYSLNDEENFKKYKALFDKLQEDIKAGLKKEEC